jgi:hypothetical protein
MPRPRKHDPSIPAHIDQRKLPVGVYWDRRDRYWYTIAGGKRMRVAAADAMLSELHQAMELAQGVQTDTLDYMLAKFEESAKYKALSEATRADYGYCRLALQRHKTKLGCSFADLRRAMLTPPVIQKLIDTIAEKHPAKANHVKRYLSAAFKWGIQRGHATSNPAAIVSQAKERKAHRMPEHDLSREVIAFLRVRGALPARREGALAPYLWAVAEIAYRCRMRSVEVRMLTDASASDEGIRVVRVKGSRGNLTTWCPELREAWGWLIARRARIWLKRGSARAKETRPLVVSERGVALSKSALNSAWQRAMAAAIETGVIDDASRFGLHGLKHRGITDTPKADKKAGGGHKTEAMTNLYDHELQVVDPAGKSR